MTPAVGTLDLLGPQRHRVTVDRVVDRLAPRGPIATITAGWQERESEDSELDDHLGGRSANLSLYRRADEVWAADRELAEGHRALGQRLKTLRRAYNVQLAALMSAWTQLLDLSGETEVLDPERAAAAEAVRALDARHLRRVSQLRQAYETRYAPAERPAVARHRAEVAGLVEQAELVVITGGHVAVLLNRLRLFGLADLLRDRHVVAWSAGAMALGSTVVLFHDRPPWGGGHAEAFEHGLGLYDDIVPLPHGDTRLDLADPGRVARMATRFWPARCVVLEPGTHLIREDHRWRTAGPARRLSRSGRTRSRVP